MAEDEQPETLEEIVRRVLGEQKSHGHRQWGLGVRTAIRPPTTQPYLNFTQAAAVQNTWYTALNVQNARLVFISIGDTVAAEDLELRLTIDGQAFTGGQLAAAAGTFYAAGFNNWLGTAVGSIQFDVTGGWPQYRAFWIEGRSVKLEIRKTSAVGASSLRVTGIYQLW